MKNEDGSLYNEARLGAESGRLANRLRDPANANPDPPPRTFLTEEMAAKLARGEQLAPGELDSFKERIMQAAVEAEHDDFEREATKNLDPEKVAQGRELRATLERLNIMLPRAQSLRISVLERELHAAKRYVADLNDHLLAESARYAKGIVEANKTVRERLDLERRAGVKTAMKLLDESGDMYLEKAAAWLRERTEEGKL